MHSHETDFLTLCAEIVDSLTDALGYRAHSDYHALSLRIAIIVKETIVATCDLRHLFHIVFNHLGHCIIVRVASLTVLEVNVGVLCHTASYRSIRVECALAELSKRVAVDKRSKIILIYCLDFLNLMRCAESVEEVYKRNTALDRREVGDCGKIHNLLH